MKRDSLSMMGAVFTALLSTLCCLPAFSFLFFGVSSGVLTYFTTLEYTRIPLVFLTIGFFIFTFVNFRKKISCKCTKKELLKQYILFLIFFIVIIALLFYPELIPYFMD